MGQSSVILAFAATALVAIMVVGMQRSNKDAEVDLAVYHNTALAREASMTGVNLTVRRLVDEPDQWFSNTSDYEYATTAYNGASFAVTAASTHPDTIAIVSTGTQHAVPHRIEAVFAKGLISGGISEAFKYAIITDEDLTLNGAVEITTPAPNNANIHANGDLTSNGRNVHVEGFATFGPDGSGTVNPEKAIDQIFDPNTDQNGNEVNVYEDDEVEIPVLDPSLYSSSPPADLVVNGDTALFSINSAWLSAHGYDPAIVGKKDHPFLLYVGGNLTTNAPVVMDGIYFQVIVAGTIVVNSGHNITASTVAVPANNANAATWDAWKNANLDADGKTKLGLFSDGNITVSGGVSITAQIFTNNKVTLNGGGGNKQNIVGGIVSSELDIKVNGGYNIRYTELATIGLIEEFESDTPEGVRLVDWAEF